jgi:hypothetical protein
MCSGLQGFMRAVSLALTGGETLRDTAQNRRKAVVGTIP